jgi:threonine dehydratase
MAQSLMRGERVALSRVDAFADGVAVKQVRRSGGVQEWD